MPTNQGSITPNPSARFSSLLLAMRSDSPPTLPYAPAVDCDPADIVTLLPPMPVDTHLVTARGHAAVNTSDKHK